MSLQAPTLTAEIRSLADLLAFRHDVRVVLRRTRFSAKEQERALLALTELGTNLVRHARAGELQVTLPDERSAWLVLTSVNLPGPDGRTAGPPGAGTIRSGLESLLRLMDEVEFPEELPFRVVCRKAEPNPSR